MRRVIFSLLLLVTFIVAQAQISAPASTEKPDTDPKYLAGAVIDDNGEAVLRRTVALAPGRSQSEVMNMLDGWLIRCMNDQRVRHSVRLEQPAANELQQHCVMELTFSQALLAHDFADLSYVLVLKAESNQVVMEMHKISYKYRGGDKVQKYAAEDMITDKVALNKRQDKMVLGYKKFRMKTIDFMDELQASLAAELSK